MDFISNYVELALDQPGDVVWDILDQSVKEIYVDPLDVIQVPRGIDHWYMYQGIRKRGLGRRVKPPKGIVQQRGVTTVSIVYAERKDDFFHCVRRGCVVLQEMYGL